MWGRYQTAGLDLAVGRYGQAVNGSGVPCNGVLYLTNRRDQIEEDAAGLSSSEVTYRNRAVEFSSAGGLRVVRYDPTFDSGDWR